MPVRLRSVEKSKMRTKDEFWKFEMCFIIGSDTFARCAADRIPEEDRKQVH